MIFHGLTLYPGSELANLLPELFATFPTGSIPNGRIIRYAGDGSNPQGLYFYNGTAWEKVSGSASVTGVLKADGSITFSASQNAGGFSITNLATPTNSGDAATKGYVDSSLSTGNAATATKLQTARTLSTTGDATGSASFDGSTNAAIALTLSSTGVTAGAYTKVTVDAKGRVTSATTLASSDVTAALGFTPLSLGGGTLTGALILNADPSASLGAVTKQYVDNMVQGLKPKPGAKAATTAQITLSGAQTIDGIALVAGDTCLVKAQTLPQENGLYVVAAGAWTRHTSADIWTELVSAYVWIEQGTLNGDSGWLCTSDQGGTLGTTALNWTQFSGAGQITAGAGLSKTGNTLSLATSGVTAGAYTKVTVDSYGRVTSATTLESSDVTAALGFTPLNKAGDAMSGALAMGNQKITGLATPTAAADAVTKSYVDSLRFQYTSGTASTSHVITHNLGTQYLLVVVIDPATGKQFMPSDITFTSASALTITLSTAMNIVAVLNV